MDWWDEWLLTDQMDEPVAGSVTGPELHFDSRWQQGGGGVLVWAGIIKDELVEPFHVKDGHKINSRTYFQFLEDTFFKQWYRKKSASFKKTMIVQRDNAPPQASKYCTARPP